MNAELEYDEIEIDPQISPTNGIQHKETLPNGVTIIGYLWHDQDTSNPCEDCDGVGKVRSFSPRHINNIDRDEAVVMLDDDAMVVPLSYFEHGNSIWDTIGSLSRTPDFRWDGVEFAGIWEPDQSCRDEIYHRYKTWKKEQGIRKTDEKTRRAKYQEIATVLAKQCCETYTSWVNGECYGYSVEVFDNKNRFVKTEDQCGGFIGSEYAESELESAFNSTVEQYKE